jgi:hypothetical protein
VFSSSVVNSICTHTTKFNQDLKYKILWNCVHAVRNIHTQKQGWSKSDCPTSWVFNITVFWKMCLFYVLRWEIGGESSTTGPLERTSPYHWISIPPCPHTHTHVGQYMKRISQLDIEIFFKLGTICWKNCPHGSWKRNQALS